MKHQKISAFIMSLSLFSSLATAQGGDYLKSDI